jgi:hypothetical protein
MATQQEQFTVTAPAVAPLLPRPRGAVQQQQQQAKPAAAGPAIRFFVWQLTMWERFNAWLYGLVLVLALLLLSSYCHQFPLRYALWLLAPQALYVGFVLDTLYMHTASSGGGAPVPPAKDIIRTMTRRGVAVRVVACVLACALNIVLLALLFVYGFSSRVAEPTRVLRTLVPAVYYAIVATGAGLVAIAVVQLVGIYVGYPYAAAQQRALRMRLVSGGGTGARAP